MSLLKEGQLLSERFEIVSLLGRGGMAEVYLASDRRLGGELCVKLLLPHLRSDPLVRARFEREVAAVRRLEHPGIVRIHELLEDGEWLYFTMQHVPGADLKRHLRRHGALSVASCVEIGACVAAALGAAHAEGIVHRDVKPQNVLVGAEGQVKLVDFGLAHTSSVAGLSMGSMLLGTPEYSAPELLSGAVPDPRADLYSLGVVLFEMASGQLPFRGTSVYELLRRQVEEPAPRLRSLRPELPDWLDELVARALAKDPEDRFQTAEQLRDALLRANAPAEPGRGLLATDGGLEELVPAEALCPRCSSALLPFVALCLECGHAPLVLRESARGPYLLVLRAAADWRLGAYVRPGNDPLTYEQKSQVVGLLKELSGARVLPVEELDARLRNLPAVAFGRLSRDAASAIRERFDAIGVRTAVRHRLSPLNLSLVGQSSQLVAIVSMLYLSILLFLTLPYFNLGLTLSVGLLGIGSSLAFRIATLRPLARLAGAHRLARQAPALAARCLEVLPRLRSPRLKRLVRRLLARHAAIASRLAAPGQPVALEPLRAELPALEQLAQRALTLAERIQSIEDAVSGLREAELFEAVQQLDAEIDETSAPAQVERLLAERAAHVRGLESLGEAQRTLSALYAELIRASSALGALLARLGSVEGHLEQISARELPHLLERLEAHARLAAGTLEGPLLSLGPPARDAPVLKPEA